MNSKIESDLWKKSMMVRSRQPITIPKAETCSNNLNQGGEENIEGSVRILWSLTGPITGLFNVPKNGLDFLLCT